MIFQDLTPTTLDPDHAAIDMLMNMPARLGKHVEVTLRDAA